MGSIFGKDRPECENISGFYPTAKQFYIGLGAPYAITLYVSSALVAIILGIQFLILVRHFFQHVPSSRRVVMGRVICDIFLNIE